MSAGPLGRRGNTHDHREVAPPHPHPHPHPHSHPIPLSIESNAEHRVPHRAPSPLEAGLLAPSNPDSILVHPESLPGAPNAPHFSAGYFKWVPPQPPQFRHIHALLPLAIALPQACGNSPASDVDLTPDASQAGAGGTTDAAAQGGSSPEGGAGEASSPPPAGCVQGAFLPFLGNLHAHSGNSDGELSPAEAFAYARDQGHLDIFVLTDHLEQLYTGASKWSDCKQAADAANAPGTYLACAATSTAPGSTRSRSAPATTTCSSTTPCFRPCRSTSTTSTRA